MNARHSRLAAGVGMVALVTLAGALRPGIAQSPSIAYVQGNYAVAQNAPLSVAAPFTSAQAAGNLNVIAVGWRNTSAHVRSIGDQAGNTYTLAAGPTVRSG